MMTTEVWVGLLAGLVVLVLLLGVGLLWSTGRAADSERWRKRAAAAEERVTLMREDARVTTRMQPGIAVLADRLADAEEALAELKGTHNRLRGEFQAQASQLADRLSEQRVSDLHERLLQYSRQMADLVMMNAELRVRCGEDSDSDLDTDLTPT